MMLRDDLWKLLVVSCASSKFHLTVPTYGHALQKECMLSSRTEYHHRYDKDVFRRKHIVLLNERVHSWITLTEFFTLIQWLIFPSLAFSTSPKLSTTILLSEQLTLRYLKHLAIPVRHSSHSSTRNVSYCFHFRTYARLSESSGHLFGGIIQLLAHERITGCRCYSVAVLWIYLKGHRQTSSSPDVSSPPIQIASIYAIHRRTCCQVHHWLASLLPIPHNRCNLNK